MPDANKKAPLVEFAERWCSHEKVAVTTDDIAKLENEIGVRLPRDYTEAICETGALWSTDTTRNDSTPVDQIFGPKQIVTELIELSRQFASEVDFIPIGCESSDLYAFRKSELQGAEQETAPVYLLDLYVPMHEDPAKWPYPADVEHIADSFTGWITSLLSPKLAG